MSFDLTALTAYVEDQDFPIIAQVQAVGGLAQVVDMQTGIKGSSNLQFMDTDVVFGADGCSRTPAGTTAFSQRTITVGAIAISEDLCVKDLNGYWTQTLVKKGVAGELELPDAIEAAYVERKTNTLQRQLAISDFQGDTLSGTNNLSYYDGALKIIDASGSAVDGNTGGVTVATGVDETNILAILDAMWLARPENLREKENVSLWMPLSYYDFYVVALKNANLFHYSSQDGDVKFYGTNLTLRPTVGLTGVDRMIMMADDNCVIGMDGDADEDSFEFRLNPATNKSIFFDVTFKRGVQVRFPDEIVEFTLVP